LVNLFPFDEIDAFKAEITKSDSSTLQAADVEDEVLDLLIMSYVFGTNAANEMMGTDYPPNMDEMRETIEEKVAGKNYKERISEHIDEGRPDLIGAVADTDSVRVYNEAILKLGAKAGARNKTWHTMMDERVRDTHSPLEGISVPLDAYFYTWDEDRALAPGGFEKAQNNVNCRCILEIS
jgi:hypothetical protein